MVITHPHGDHCGRAPRLRKLGFRGKIYVTHAGADIMKILWVDSARLQEQEANRINAAKIRAHKARIAAAEAPEGEPVPHSLPQGKPISKRSKSRQINGRRRIHNAPKMVEPLYTQVDAVDTFGLIKGVDFDERFELAPGVFITFLYAGHILGAGMVLLEAGWNGEKRTTLFVGNVGRQKAPLLREIARIYRVDYIVSEATYGDDLHPVEDDLPVLGDILTKGLLRASVAHPKWGYGVIVIPVFSIDRGQVLLYRIKRLKEMGIIPADTPVYVDSPMFIAVTEVYRRHKHLLNDEIQAIFAAGDDPFTFPGLVEVPKFNPALLEPQSKPAIVLCAPGMGNGGRSSAHLSKRSQGENNTIVEVGFQAPGTPGANLLALKDVKASKNNPPMVTIVNERVPLRATVEFMRHYSAHADWKDLIDLFQYLERPPRTIFLVHGAPKALEGLKGRLEKLKRWKVEIPTHKSCYVL
jgi:metallo-beta-lactamase family protein